MSAESNLDLGMQPVWLALDDHTRVMAVSGMGLILGTDDGQLMKLEDTCLVQYVSVEQPAIVSAHSQPNTVIRHREIVSVSTLAEKVEDVKAGAVITFQVQEQRS